METEETEFPQAAAEPLPPTAAQLRSVAWSALWGKWGLASAVTMLIALITMFAQKIASGVPIAGALLICIFLILPIEIGFNAAFALACFGDERPGMRDVFWAFYDDRYFPCIVLKLLIGLLVSLWTLLLIVPGIVAALSYAMAPFIMVENPEIAALDAIKRSREMMRGHKWRLFCLGFSYFGWLLLCAATFGVASFWVAPYVNVGIAAFYRDLKDRTRK